jgi:predicted HTH domain antitoxin
MPDIQTAYSHLPINRGPSLHGERTDWYQKIPANKFVYNENIAYAMGTISARVPDELETELELYLDEENLDRSTAVRKLLAEGLEDWRRQQALDKLSEGSITFSKAAELAEMTVWDFAQLADDHDITWVDEEHLDTDLKAL